MAGSTLQPKQVSIRSPHRSKGRPKTPVFGVRWLGFQSAPLTEARGDKLRAEAEAMGTEFQSAPLTEARGDRRSGPVAADPRCFNPLPSPKQGETSLDDMVQASEFPVSIRSPHRSKGRPIDGPVLVVRGDVSIRSPHRSKGRL